MSIDNQIIYGFIIITMGVYIYIYTVYTYGFSDFNGGLMVSNGDLQ